MENDGVNFEVESVKDKSRMIGNIIIIFMILSAILIVVYVLKIMG